MDEERQSYWENELANYEALAANGDTTWDGAIASIKEALADGIPTRVDLKAGTPVSEPKVNEPKVPEVKQDKPDEPKNYSQQIEHNKAILADLRGKQNRVHSSQNIVRPEKPVQLNDYQKAHEQRKQLIKDIRSGKVEGNNES